MGISLLLGWVCISGSVGWRILIIPDGNLHGFSFNLLYIPNTEEFLFSQYEIVHNPSSTTIDYLRQYAIITPQQATSTIAIFADPVFSADDARLEGVFQLSVISYQLSVREGKGKRKKGK